MVCSVFYQAAGLACDSMYPIEILGKGFAVVVYRGAGLACEQCVQCPARTVRCCACVCSMFPFEILGKGFAVFVFPEGAGLACSSVLVVLFAVVIRCGICCLVTKK